MLSIKLSTLFFVILLLFSYLKANETDEEDYDEDDHEELEDCEYEIDFKTYKKAKKLNLCDSLKTLSLQSRIQIQIYSNHTEEKAHLRATTTVLKNSNQNKSLIILTTDLLENFQYGISLLVIEDYQLLNLSILESIVSSLINVDINLLNKNMKKTLFIAKGGHKQILSCSGNFYPKQDLKILNITTNFNKTITCTKDTQKDRFFTLKEKIYYQKNFKLVDIHQDDPKKISRTVWYTCNNPKACTIGVQTKTTLDKTVNYVVKYLQKGRTEKKPASG